VKFIDDKNGYHLWFEPVVMEFREIPKLEFLVKFIDDKNGYHRWFKPVVMEFREIPKLEFPKNSKTRPKDF